MLCLRGVLPSLFPPTLLRCITSACVQRSFERVAHGSAPKGTLQDYSKDATFVRQGTDAWRRLRMELLTASDMATALGFWRNRDILWERKIELRPPFEGNSATAHGVTFEPIAARALEKYLGEPLGECPLEVSNHFPYLGASPDRYLGDDTVIEVKCPYRGKVYRGVPFYYIPQVMAQSAITGRNRILFLCWTVACFDLYEMTFDAHYWRRILPHLQAFWMDHVLPAKEQLRCRPGDSVAVEEFRPSPTLPETSELIALSRQVAHRALHLTRQENPF